MSAAMIATQMTITRQGWLAFKRIQLASAPDRQSLVCCAPFEARVGPSGVVRHELPPLLRSSYDG